MVVSFICESDKLLGWGSIFAVFDVVLSVIFAKKVAGSNLSKSEGSIGLGLLERATFSLPQDLHIKLWFSISDIGAIPFSASQWEQIFTNVLFVGSSPPTI